MSIVQKVKEDLVAAMKAKDAKTLSALRMLSTAFKNEAINQLKQELEDEGALKVIKSEVKKRNDSIESYRQGGREEMAASEEDEKQILERYMPAQMSAEEITQKIEAILQSTPADQRNLGPLMGRVMKELGPSADGAIVRKVLAEKINS
jgi:uncharacterized protein YqeY